MAGKRQATSDLNHDNWDREEEPEDRGTFRTANEDELKNRVIKKARRKIAPGSVSTDAADGGTATKSVFSGFSGFGKTALTTTTAAASPFSFLSNIPAAGTSAGTTSSIVSSSTVTTSATPTFSFVSGSATSAAKTIQPSTSTFSFGKGASSPTSMATEAKTATATFSFNSVAGSSTKVSDTNDEKKDRSDTKPSEYCGKLKGLNQAVSEWIKTHVDTNPLCILTPIFKDYEKYLKEFDEERNKQESAAIEKSASSSGGIESVKFSGRSSTDTSSAFATPSASTVTVAKTNGFSFGLKKTEEASGKPATAVAATGFSFGLKSSTESSAPPTTSSSSTPTSGFTFGKSLTNDNAAVAPIVPKPFSFTTNATPFSFGNIQPPPAASTTNSADNEDDDDEPPKNDFKQVVEDDAVYSKKCKVFVKKDGNFVDKGVGTLYLKPIESSGKTQLIVRADTNLGNILVNIILSTAIPSQRMGKNNVMMVCLPTPEVDKPTSMLLRVKTGEEADELLENIDKYKK